MVMVKLNRNTTPKTILQNNLLYFDKTKLEATPKSSFTANLPTPTPPLAREGLSATKYNKFIFSYMTKRTIPLPTGREGLGVGRSRPMALFGVNSYLEFLI
jgi:hypothetical protein